MIEKLEFYHGAALVRIVEDTRCTSVAKHECGYLVNVNRFVFLKYSTKAQSPWRFTVTEYDISRLEMAASRFPTCVLGLVCGGDGICGISWESGRELIGGASGWLAARRSFNECYAVNGPVGSLRRKVALNQWPTILFQEKEG